MWVCKQFNRGRRIRNIKHKRQMTELEKCELAKNKGFTYDPNTGEVKGMRGKVITGKKHNYIYCQVSQNGKMYEISAHRLAWYLYYGELPKNFIDHIDCNPLNNKIENLRDVTHQQNHFNRNNTNGYCWIKKVQKYEARIVINGKRKHLGRFVNEIDARNAYLTAKAKYHTIK